MNIKDLTLKGVFKFLMEVHLLMNAIMLPENPVFSEVARYACGADQEIQEKQKISETQSQSGSFFEPMSPAVPNPPQQFERYEKL